MPINIVKIGGNVINSESKLRGFLEKFHQLNGEKILIHGGGKVATQMAKDLGIKTKMVDGRRITDAAMRDVVTMVYGGLINKSIVSQLQSFGTNALGLSGADGASVISKKRTVSKIDYGFVGDIERVNTDFINNLLSQGISPVFAPLSFDFENGILNTNADSQASAIATSLAETRVVNLIYCFEKKGVLSNPEDDNSVIPVLTPESYQSYKSEGVIYEGMIPKLDNSFDAIDKGVKKVIICEADDLLSAAESGETGTLISK